MAAESMRPAAMEAAIMNAPRAALSGLRKGF
jgi:hypothetical protein